MAKWEELPVDIFLIIFGKYLSVGDILNLRATSRLFLSITQMHSLWYTLLHTCVLEKNTPIPGLADRSIESLSAGELERFTRRAIQLRRNWSSPVPVATRQIHLAGPESLSRNTSLVFIHGRGRPWLLSVDSSDSDSPQLHFIVKCWDLEVTPPACVARRHLSVLGSFVVNNDRESSALIAVQCPHTEIWGINPSATDPDSAFVTLGAFKTRLGEIHLFSGSRVLTREGELRYVLWDFHNPDRDIELHNPERSQHEKLLAAIVTEEVAILFRILTVEIYPLSSLRTAVAAGTVIHPVAQHHFSWRIDNICVTEQVRWPGGQRATFNVLIRFGSWYPWPINLLHHYMLYPNKSYAPSNGVNANNIPYSVSPVFIQSIASPVRLFASSPMILGLYGTALWIDSHTEEYFAYSGQGQRLAGQPLLPDGPPDEFDDPAAEPSVQLPSSQMASVVFRVGEHDDWTHLAVDEEEGRVAVGSSTDGITVFEYAQP